MRQRDLIPFFTMTFLIAWGILGLYIFASEIMIRLFGNLTGQHPLFYLAVYAPAISALTLILYRHGIQGMRLFLSRLLLWRASIYWYVMLVFIVPLVFYMAALFKQGALDTLFPFASITAYLSALSLMAIKGPIEEIGWRGLALPCFNVVWRPFGLLSCSELSGRSGTCLPLCSAAHRKAPGR